MDKNDPSHNFVLGAKVMFAGFLAGSVLKSFTIDNVRNTLLFVEEVKNKLAVSSQPRFIVKEKDEEEEDSMGDFYHHYTRESPPPPPPSEESKPRFAVPVSISLGEDDFYEKINEEAMAGRSLVDDWTNV